MKDYKLKQRNLRASHTLIVVLGDFLKKQRKSVISQITRNLYHLKVVWRVSGQKYDLFACRVGVPLCFAVQAEMNTMNFFLHLREGRKKGNAGVVLIQSAMNLL